MNIRRFKDEDWNQVWTILEPVFRAGETYAFSTEISETEACDVWVVKPEATYVAVDDKGAVIGTYYIKANQPERGAHVCNCGYVVSESARGQGLATAMCLHSQKEAVELGFRAMQYNLVVSTNTTAVKLWKKLGFQMVGTLPEAFHHPRDGFVDAIIFYKQLSG